jgi:hypothetical protein
MRFKDYMQMFGISLALGFVLSIVFYFIWTDAYKSTTNSFWISLFGIGVLSLPISYWSTKKGSTCAQCSKAFVLSENGQTDIENFVKYKSESVTENGTTRTKNVPYNVRRYHQHMKCDNCGYEYKYEAKSESKA